MEKNKNGIQNKQPEFFSYGYSLILKTFNWLLIAYLMFSFIIYLFYYFLNENIVRKKYFDEQFIFKNSYYACIISLQVAFSIYSLYKKSLVTYLFYFGYTIFLNAIFLFSRAQGHLHQGLVYIELTISGINLLQIIYFYFKSIGYFKDRLVGVNPDSIVHEIRLRSDMMKINFNGFLINSKMHKMFPNLLFKKEDYYFMNKDIDQPDFLEHSKFNNTMGLNSKSTIDTEYEPLK
jgi:hypothetical protein